MTKHIKLAVWFVVALLLLWLVLGLDIQRLPDQPSELKFKFKFWESFGERHDPRWGACFGLRGLKRAQQAYFVDYGAYAPDIEALNPDGWEYYVSLTYVYEIRVSSDGKSWVAIAETPRYPQVYAVSDDAEEPYLLRLKPETGELDGDGKRR